MDGKGMRIGTKLLAFLAALSLLAAMGCQSTPEPEADPVPQDPYEEPADDFHDEPEPHGADDPYGEPADPMAHDLPTSSEDVSDDQVESFANAYVSVMELRMTYEPQLQEAASEEEVMAIQEAAEGEIVAAVEAEDLTVEEFNAIADLLAYDEGLRDRVQEHIDAMM